MPRKSHSQSNNIPSYILIGILVIALIYVGKAFLLKRSEHFADITELSVSEFKSNANSLSGNTYRISGQISEKLKWTSNKGQLLSLTVEKGENGAGVIPIMVPASNTTNLERGQRYIFKVQINREGLPIADDIKAL